MDKEKNEKNIFDLSSGGFDSTVRLAKSSSDMWTPIFAQNADNIITVLDTYISKLQDFKEAIEENNKTSINQLITKANKIKKVLINNSNHGSTIRYNEILRMGNWQYG